MKIRTTDRESNFVEHIPPGEADSSSFDQDITRL
jgi:hypothetical protein